MPLRITSITRVSPPPCQHFRVTVNDNGEISEKVFHATQPDELIQFGQEGSVRVNLAFLWMADMIKRGASFARIVNREIEVGI